eukprot:643513-Pyramimonas_sp.AAC.1
MSLVLRGPPTQLEEDVSRAIAAVGRGWSPVHGLLHESSRVPDEEWQGIFAGAPRRSLFLGAVVRSGSVGTTGSDFGGGRLMP